MQSCVEEQDQRRRKHRARGFSQSSGSNYDETSAPVPGLESVRLLSALLAKADAIIHQKDVVMALLHPRIFSIPLILCAPEGKLFLPKI